MPSTPTTANERRRHRYATDAAYREKIIKENQKYQTKNAEKMRETARARRRRNPERAFDRRLLWKFGISKADYDALLEKQGGCCAICGGTQVNGRKNLDVDHDHRTGRVRGLLCGYCNRALGLLKDSPEVLRLAANYLDR
jgi:hypothetical protein